MPYLRQNTATSVRFGPLVAASDGYSYLPTTTTLSASNVVVFKADGTVTDLPVGTLAMPRPGWLLINVAASDVTLAGRMTYTMGNAATTVANLPIWREFEVVTAQVFDSIAIGNDLLQVDVQQITGAVPSNAAFLVVSTVNANILLITGAAVSAALAGFGIHVSSVAAGVGVNVSSVNAGVGVNASSINGGAATNITFNANVLTITGAAVSAAFAGYVIPVNVAQVTGAAPSAAIPNFLLDYVMFTPGAAAQTITVKDTLRVIAAAVAGRCTGATGAAMVFHGPSGESRVSAALASGNRTGTTWVTGIS